MKRVCILFLLFLSVLGYAWGREYNLKGSQTIGTAGIERIVISIQSPRCVACISSLNHDIAIEGNDSSQDLILSLTGNIRSNRRRAVPDLIWERKGRELHVSLYPENLVVLGLVSGGKAVFRAGIPSGFNGSVEVLSDSDNVVLRNLRVSNLSVKVRSGNLSADDLSAKDLDISCSSGNISLDKIGVSGNFNLSSSSGNVNIGQVAVQGKGSFTVSSGNFKGDTLTAAEVDIRSRSGKIDMNTILSKGGINIKSESGKVQCGRIEGERIRVVASSGDISLGELQGELDIESSSGNVALGLSKLAAGVTVSNSSGNIRIRIPAGTGYSVDIETGSGKITLDDSVIGVVNQERDKIRGDVNGGGPLVKLRASSGNIAIQKI